MKYEVSYSGGSSLIIEADFVDVLGDVLILARKRKSSEEGEEVGGPFGILPPEILLAIKVENLYYVRAITTSKNENGEVN